MSRKHRHIRARKNEWIHVHRQHDQRNTGMDIPTMIGVGAGIFIFLVLIIEIIKATYPFLIILGVFAAILWSKRRS